MSSSTPSHSGSDGSDSSQFASWEDVSSLSGAEIGVRRPVLDLSPTRAFRNQFRRSMSFNSWKAEGFECPTISERSLPHSHRSSDEVNNAENEICELQETKIEELKDHAMTQEVKPLKTKDSLEQALIPLNNKIIGPLPSKKFLDLILLHQGSLQDDDSLRSRPQMCDSPDSLQELQRSRIPLDTRTVDSAEQYGQEVWSQMNTDFDSASLASEESKISRRRTWSTEPLDSFTDGTQSKARQLRHIRRKQKCLKESNRPKSSSKLTERSSLISYRKITDVSRKKSTDQKLQIEATGPAMRERLCKGLVCASRQVLKSVWTWTVVAVVFAGVHIRSTGSSKIPQRTFIEDREELYEFDWDDDFDLDLGFSDDEE